jgi:hypothetical protein
MNAGDSPAVTDEGSCFVKHPTDKSGGFYRRPHTSS